MAYGVEQDRLRALLPDGFISLRPVLRINAELHGETKKSVYIEFNTAVERDGVKGWLNVGHWVDGKDNKITCEKSGEVVVFNAPFLEIVFTKTGVLGGCPAEKDNDGCFFSGETPSFRAAEVITAPKEFCDCTFKWKFTDGDAHGKSEGKTLPAVFAEPNTTYERLALTPKNAASIPCVQVLGAYCVCFER